MIFCGREISIQDSTDSFAVEEIRKQGESRQFLQLDKLLGMLRDPLTKSPLSRDGDLLRVGEQSYPIVGGNPHLFPCDMARLKATLAEPNLLERFPSLPAIEQYCAFGLLKSSGATNLDYGDLWYGRHLYRARKLLSNAQGVFLDVGCDDAFISRGMLSEQVQYVGLEPSTGVSRGIRVCGLGEFLPFADGCFDGVGFQTSLDHVFDYHLALAEARRVLRPGGRLYLATLLWTERAHLFTDTAHFHHFRPAQIETALADGFEVERVDAYVWKGNTHRFGVYMAAVKK